MYTGKMENYRFEWWHHSISSIELNAGGGGGELPFTELKRYYREALAHLTIALIYMVIKTGFVHKRKLKES